MKKPKISLTPVRAGFLICLGFVALLFGLSHFTLFPIDYQAIAIAPPSLPVLPPPPPPLNKTLYDQKMLALANNPISTISASSTATSTIVATSTTHFLWPTKTVYPNSGALLPFNRIVAYYGNFYSANMGVLGAYPPEVMLQKLSAEVAKWQAADPTTPVIPAIDYIAITAQGSPGVDGKYRIEMPDSQIDEAIQLANQVNGIVILDVQVGLSTLQAELPTLEKYLKMDKVELAIDPEFSMKSGNPPGTSIGSFDATDINYAAHYLASLVQANNLPPKILIIHRFTEDMVTNSEDITPLPEVQIVMDMDGWGYVQQKIKSYLQVIYAEPVQFTGMKLFYKNDLGPPTNRMMTTQEVLNLRPIPIFIQYQ